MKDDINTYIVRLKKNKDVIDIDILNEFGFIIDYYYAPFNSYLNKYYIFKFPTEFVTKILLYHNIIEQIDQESTPKFILTQTALLTLI